MALPKPNAVTECRMIMTKRIDDNTILPDHFKPQAKEHIGKMFQLMSEYLGHLELLYLREKQHQRESEEFGKPNSKKKKSKK